MVTNLPWHLLNWAPEASEAKDIAFWRWGVGRRGIGMPDAAELMAVAQMRRSALTSVGMSRRMSGSSWKETRRRWRGCRKPLRKGHI